MYLYKLKTLKYNKNPEFGRIPVVLRRFLELDFTMYFSIFLIIIGICRFAQISMFHLIFSRKYFWWCQRSRTGLTESKEFTKTFKFKNIQISASLKKLFVCFFVFFVPLSSFHSFGDITIAGEGLQILIHARHLWPLTTEGSLACHTYNDTGHPFLMVVSEDQWHSHLMPSIWQWSYHYLF